MRNGQSVAAELQTTHHPHPVVAEGRSGSLGQSKAKLSSARLLQCAYYVMSFCSTAVPERGF